MLHVADAADTASVVAGEGFWVPDVIDACPTLGATDKITPNVRNAKQSIATSGVAELFFFEETKTEVPAITRVSPEAYLKIVAWV